MQLARSTKTNGRPKRDYGYKPENRKVQYPNIPRRLRVKAQAVRMLEPCKTGPIRYPETSATTNLLRKVPEERRSQEYVNMTVAPQCVSDLDHQ